MVVKVIFPCNECFYCCFDYRLRHPYICMQTGRNAPIPEMLISDGCVLGYKIREEVVK